MNSNCYQIGAFLVDLDVGLLQSKGIEQKLPTLSREVLLCLVNSAPKIVTQDELISTVWKGVVVTDENLQQRIRLIRKALGDDSKNPEYIETIRGVGYQLIAETQKIECIDENKLDISLVPQLLNRVTASCHNIMPKNKKNRIRLYLGITFFIFIAVVLISYFTKGIAPLVDIKNHSNDVKENSFYAQGMTYYKRYRKNDNQIAIQLFKQSIDDDPEYAPAYAGLANSILQGVYQYDFSIDKLEEALSIIDEGLTKDPMVAQLYKARGFAMALKGHYGKTIEAYHQAINIDPTLHDAITNLAFTYREIGQLNQALKWHKQAIYLVPDSAGGYQHLAQTYAALNMPEEAEYWFNKSISLKPDYSLGRVFYGNYLNGVGEYGKAIEQAQEILRLTPSYIRAKNVIGDAYYYSSSFDKAIPYYQEVEASVGRNKEYAALRLGVLYALIGEDKASLVRLEPISKSLNLKIERGAQDPDIMLDLARVYAVRGEDKIANYWLKAAFDAGEIKYHLIIREPAFMVLSATPEFQIIIKEMKLKLFHLRQNTPFYR
ncbi:MAG: tetratricopeptide repeat protein [Colwellia sp.]|nr:tetratricopeptide repeat protein [Colwellia sp.]